MFSYPCAANIDPRGVSDDVDRKENMSFPHKQRGFIDSHVALAKVHSKPTQLRGNAGP